MRRWRTGLGSADKVPPTLRLQVLERFGRRCDPAGGCGRPIRPGERWSCSPADNFGELRPLCAWCDPDGAISDLPERARYDRARLRHAGIAILPEGRPLPGTVISGWRHRLRGGWERRP